jgi:O-antigen/teichoic acid export membrane protein
VRLISRFFKTGTDDVKYNLFSNLAKIFGKSIWQMTIPFILSIKAFNTYSLLQNITSVLIQTTNLGSRQIVLRHNREELPLFAFLIHSLILLLIQITIINFFFVISIAQNLLICGLVFFTNAYFNYSARLKGLLKFKISLISEVLGLLLFILASLLLFSLNENPNWPMILEILVLVIISTYIIARLKLLKDLSVFNFRNFNGFTSAIYKVGIVNLSDTILWRFVPIYFLQKISDDNPNMGIFNLALLLGNAFVLVPQSLLEGWIPTWASRFRENKIDFNLFIKSYFKKYYITLLAVTSIAIIIISIALNTIYIKYANWFFPVIIFSVLRIISSISDINVAILYAQHLERLLIGPSLIGAFSIFVFSLVFSQKFGLEGVIAAYLLSKFVFVVSVIFNYKKALRITND